MLGKTYKVTYSISDYVSGNFKVQVGSNGFGQARSSNGTFVEYIEYSGSNFLYLKGSSSFTGSVTNISVKEVGQDWSLGSGWSIGENKATSDASANGYLNQQVYEIGKKYKLNFEVLEGTIELRSAQYSQGVGFYTTGTYSIEVIPSTTSTHFYVYTGFGQSSITNISVKEITDDTNIPRINYEGFSYQDSLGSELIVNGDFATDSNWYKENTWTIADGAANGNGANGSTEELFQNDVFSGGKTYSISYEIKNYVSGSVRLQRPTGIWRSANGVYTEILTPTVSLIKFRGAYFNGSIDNVSVKEYLGQEVVPDSGCGSWLLEPQSTNYSLNSEQPSTWHSSGVVIITANAATSPEGIQN